MSKLESCSFRFLLGSCGFLHAGCGLFRSGGGGLFWGCCFQCGGLSLGAAQDVRGRGAPDQVAVALLAVEELAVHEFDVVEEVLALGHEEAGELALAGAFDLLQMLQHVALVAAVALYEDLGNNIQD